VNDVWLAFLLYALGCVWFESRARQSLKTALRSSTPFNFDIVESYQSEVYSVQLIKCL